MCLGDIHLICLCVRQLMYCAMLYGVFGCVWCLLYVNVFVCGDCELLRDVIWIVVGWVLFVFVGSLCVGVFCL